MAFSNGVFTRVYNWVNDKANGIKVNATRMDAEMDGMATGLSSCLLKDGTQTVTANIPMASFKFTGLGAGSAATDSSTIGQIQSGAFLWGGTSGGTANAHTITLSPAITAYAAGQTFRFIAGNANTSTTTLNVNGIGAKTIKKGAAGNVNVIAGDITASQLVEVVYDGTNFQMTSVPLSSGVFAAVHFAGADGTVQGVQNNVTSVTRTATGKYTITLTNTKSAYTWAVCGQNSSAGQDAVVGTMTSVSSPFTLETQKAGVLADPNRVTVTFF